jgi:nucleoside-diphosphate-sugar epimerase
MTAPHLFCFGMGYTALALGRRLAADGWVIGGTSRSASKAAALREAGFAATLFDRDHPLSRKALDGVTHLLLSIPPDGAGDPVFATQHHDIASIPGLSWVGYLSTTGVYGDRGGGWVDETSALLPTGERGRRRVIAEQSWLGLWRNRGVPVHVFRLAGIYGPGRSAFEPLRAGTAKRIDKPGQVFSRIHLTDLVNVLVASIQRPRPGGVYNVCDDDPSPPSAVVAHAAALLGMPAPPLVSLEAAELSPTARSFYEDNKRVSNALIKAELGVTLRYPDFRAGLAGILAEELAQKPGIRHRPPRA